MLRFNAYVWTFCAVCWFWITTLVNGDEATGSASLAIGVGCSALAIYYTWLDSRNKE